MAAALPPRTLLVLKPSSLGDIIHTLPAVARFRAARPGWRVRWLVNEEFAPLLEGNPAVEEVVRFPRQDFRGVAAPIRVGRWLFGDWRRRSRPDLALDFQGLLRSALLGRLSGAPALLGSSDAREGATFFYHRIARTPPGPGHAVRRYLALVDEATAGAGAAVPITFPLPPGEPWAEPLPAGGFLILHPFSRGAGKSLSVEAVAEFCRGVAPRPVILVGRGTVGVGGDLPANVVNLLNRTNLRQLLNLLRHAAFVVSVDSGPMHLAAAVQPTPGRLLGIHAWSDPRRVGPFPESAWVWHPGGGLQRVGEVQTVTGPGGGRLPSPAELSAICRLVATGSGL